MIEKKIKYVIKEKCSINELHTLGLTPKNRIKKKNKSKKKNVSSYKLYKKKKKLHKNANKYYVKKFKNIESLTVNEFMFKYYFKNGLIENENLQINLWTSFFQTIMFSVILTMFLSVDGIFEANIIFSAGEFPLLLFIFIILMTFYVLYLLFSLYIFRMKIKEIAFYKFIKDILDK